MRKKRSLEIQLTLLFGCVAVPLLLLLLCVMAYAGISMALMLLTLLLGSVLISYVAYQLHQRLTYQFRGLSNLLNSMSHGDYSLRARASQSDGALDELILSINGLAERLSQQRRESVESQLLLHMVIEHIDVAIVALNEAGELRLLNPAAEKLLQPDQRDVHDNLREQLMAARSLASGCHCVIESSHVHEYGRFHVHVEEFREAGKQHKLLFVTDVRALLRSEEAKAWQSLVRVISHEINNSLSPIASLSQTLTTLITRQYPDTEAREDLVQGLTIISERANRLGQFINSYKQLTQLPEPHKQPASIANLVRTVCSLFTHPAIVIAPADDVMVAMDSLQMEQVFINLLKNAAEAMAHQPDGIIRISWAAHSSVLIIKISDEGSGISNPDNLFVPFYSTKKHGTGIGLLLCRHIVEAHDGRITIANHRDAAGCCVSIELPSSLHA